MRYIALILGVAGILVLFWFSLPYLERNLNLAGNLPAAINLVQSTTPVEPEKNIVVTAPEPFASVGSFVEIRGRARVFENTVEFVVKDGFGGVIAKSFTTSNAPDVGEFGDFAHRISIPDVRTPTGTLEVFWSSPKDGTPLDVVSIPLIFSPR